MFIDKARIFIKSGNGGNGSVSFHREKYVASGGPDGGDGGRGGSVILEADPNLSTLLDFKYKRKYAAKNGGDGRGDNCKGEDAEDLVIKVPVGTIAYDKESGLVLADLSEKGERAVIAKGGKGGFGNKRFATPTRQAPRFSKPGRRGVEREVILELKLIADVGLLGFPNVGKSTLLSASTKARPKIANYHFTTLTPNLGVVDLGDQRSFVMADIPGVIEGASEGVGLGHAFLRHVERTRLLLHVLDVSGIEGRDAVEDFHKINEELSKYSEKLIKREQIIVGNKIDLVYEKEALESFRAYFEEKGFQVFLISGVTGEGVKELLNYTYERLQAIPKEELYGEENFFKEPDIEEIPFEIVKEDGVFQVEGRNVEMLMLGVNPDDYESMQYFQRSLRKLGVIDKLKEMDVQEGDLVRLYNVEFEYME